MSEGIRRFGISSCSTRVDSKSTALDGSSSTRDALAAENLNLDMMEVDFGSATNNSPALPSLPEVEFKNCIQELEQLQEEHDRLESKHYGNIHRIETKYLRAIAPHYSKRAAIVNREGSRVRKFWLKVMRFEEELDEVISVEDEDALLYLKDIKWSLMNDRKGWKLEFFFDSYINPYFDNPILTKEIYFKRVRGQWIIEKSIGAKINWYEDKCLTKKDKRSFFNFFMEDEHFANNVEENNILIDFCQVIMNKTIPHATTIYDATFMDDEEFWDSFSEKDPLYYLQVEINKTVADQLQNIREEEASYWKTVEHIHEKRGQLVSKYLVDGISHVDGEENAMLGPAFWLNAMRGEETLSHMISEEDANALGYLKNIKFSYDTIERPDYCPIVIWKLEFFFNPNPYFENSVLTKILHITYSRGTINLRKNIGTDIEWLPGCFWLEDPEQLGVAESFFNLFNSSKTDSCCSLQDDDLEEEYKLCKTIIYRIVGHAVSYYKDQLML